MIWKEERKKKPACHVLKLPFTLAPSNITLINAMIFLNVVFLVIVSVAVTNSLLSLIFLIAFAACDGKLPNMIIMMIGILNNIILLPFLFKKWLIDENTDDEDDDDDDDDTVDDDTVDDNDNDLNSFLFSLLLLSIL